MTSASLPLVSLLFAMGYALVGVILTVRVIIGRVKYAVDVGDGGIADLGQRIRAHGNFAEQAPLAVLLLVVADLAGTPPLVIIVAGAVLLGTRVTSAIGLSRTLDQSPLRKSAAGMTQLAMLLTLVAVGVTTVVPLLMAAQ